MGLIKDKIFGVQITHSPINIIFPCAILEFFVFFPFLECVELGCGGVCKAMNTVKFHVAVGVWGYFLCLTSLGINKISV